MSVAKCRHPTARPSVLPEAAEVQQKTHFLLDKIHTEAERRGVTSHEGQLAQLVERRLYTPDVGGSSPSLPTKK